MGRAFEYRRAAKEKRWDKMSRIFPRLAKAITLAAKEGGPDPEMNAKLRTAILNAKAQNMPKDNIDAAIKRASGKEAEAYTEVIYEGKGLNISGFSFNFSKMLLEFISLIKKFLVKRKLLLLDVEKVSLINLKSSSGLNISTSYEFISRSISAFKVLYS